MNNQSENRKLEDKSEELEPDSPRTLPSSVEVNTESANIVNKEMASLRDEKDEDKTELTDQPMTQSIETEPKSKPCSNDEKPKNDTTANVLLVVNQTVLEPASIPSSPDLDRYENYTYVEVLDMDSQMSSDMDSIGTCTYCLVIDEDFEQSSDDESEVKEEIPNSIIKQDCITSLSQIPGSPAPELPFDYQVTEGILITEIREDPSSRPRSIPCTSDSESPSIFIVPEGFRIFLPNEDLTTPLSEIPSSPAPELPFDYQVTEDIVFYGTKKDSISPPKSISDSESPSNFVIPEGFRIFLPNEDSLTPLNPTSGSSDPEGIIICVIKEESISPPWSIPDSIDSESLSNFEFPEDFMLFLPKEESISPPRSIPGSSDSSCDFQATEDIVHCEIKEELISPPRSISGSPNFVLPKIEDFAFFNLKKESISPPRSIPGSPDFIVPKIEDFEKFNPKEESLSPPRSISGCSDSVVPKIEDFEKFNPKEELISPPRSIPGSPDFVVPKIEDFEKFNPKEELISPPRSIPGSPNFVFPKIEDFAFFNIKKESISPPRSIPGSPDLVVPKIEDFEKFNPKEELISPPTSIPDFPDFIFPKVDDFAFVNLKEESLSPPTSIPGSPEDSSTSPRKQKPISPPSSMSSSSSSPVPNSTSSSTPNSSQSSIPSSPPISIPSSSVRESLVDVEFQKKFIKQKPITSSSLTPGFQVEEELFDVKNEFIMYDIKQEPISPPSSISGSRGEEGMYDHTSENTSETASQDEIYNECTPNSISNYFQNLRDLHRYNAYILQDLYSNMELQTRNLYNWIMRTRPLMDQLVYDQGVRIKTEVEEESIPLKFESRQCNAPSTSGRGKKIKTENKVPMTLNLETMSYSDPGTPGDQQCEVNAKRSNLDPIKLEPVSTPCSPGKSTMNCQNNVQNELSSSDSGDDEDILRSIALKSAIVRLQNSDNDFDPNLDGFIVVDDSDENNGKDVNKDEVPSNVVTKAQDVQEKNENEHSKKSVPKESGNDALDTLDADVLRARLLSIISERIAGARVDEEKNMETETLKTSKLFGFHKSNDRIFIELHTDSDDELEAIRNEIPTSKKTKLNKTNMTNIGDSNIKTNKDQATTSGLKKSSSVFNKSKANEIQETESGFKKVNKILGKRKANEDKAIASNFNDEFEKPKTNDDRASISNFNELSGKRKLNEDQRKTSNFNKESNKLKMNDYQASTSSGYKGRFDKPKVNVDQVTTSSGYRSASGESVLKIQQATNMNDSEEDVRKLEIEQQNKRNMKLNDKNNSNGIMESENQLECEKQTKLRAFSKSSESEKQSSVQSENKSEIGKESDLSKLSIARNEFEEALVDYRLCCQELKLSRLKLSTARQVYETLVLRSHKAKMRNEGEKQEENVIKEKETTPMKKVALELEKEKQGTSKDENMIGGKRKQTDNDSKKKSKKVDYVSILNYNSNIDCNRPLCSYDLLGICNDDSCPDQHIKQ